MPVQSSTPALRFNHERAMVSIDPAQRPERSGTMQQGRGNFNYALWKFLFYR
jgi:hypothetical protein